MNHIPANNDPASQESDPENDRKHAQFRLKHFDFKVDTEVLSVDAREILKSYGAWMEALANGTIRPRTQMQSRFVDVVSGKAQPESVYERVWLELVQKRADAAKHKPVRSMRPNIITPYGAAGVPASWRYESGYRPGAKRPGDTCGVQNQIDSGRGADE